MLRTSRLTTVCHKHISDCVQNCWTIKDVWLSYWVLEQASDDPGSAWLAVVQSDIRANVQSLPSGLLLCCLSSSDMVKMEGCPYSSKLEVGTLSARLLEMQGDGRQGSKEAAPYDAIHVGASAATVPEPLIAQLRTGGRLVLPVGEADGVQELCVIGNNRDGSLRESVASGVCFMPLTSRALQLDERARTSFLFCVRWSQLCSCSGKDVCGTILQIAALQNTGVWPSAEHLLWRHSGMPLHSGYLPEWI